MNKIHTANELYDVLAKDWAWRKRELSNMRQVILSNASKPHRRDCLVRAGIALLYAHWEGFVKAAATAYVMFVDTQSMKYDELADNFVAIALRGKLNQAVSSSKIALHREVVRFFFDDMSKTCQLAVSTAINTEGNLKSELMREIVTSLGLKYDDYESKENVIDVKLLNNRNHIAHGQYLEVDVEEYELVHSEVMGLLELFFDQICNAAARGEYRRTI